MNNDSAKGRWSTSLLQCVAFLLTLCVPTLGQSAPSAAEESSWERRVVGPLQLWAPPELRVALDEAARDAEQWLPRLQEDLGVVPGTTEPFSLALVDRRAWRREAERALPVEERAIRRLDARAPEWAAGYMLSGERIGVVRLDRVNTYPFDGTTSVLVHEASHQLLHDRVGRRVPRWFDEAVATFEDRRRGLRDVAVYLQTSIFADVPPLHGLDYEFQRGAVRARRAYAASVEFLDWALRRYDRGREIGEANLIRRLVDEMASDPALDFEGAWRRAAGEPLFYSEQIWRQGRWRLDRWVPVLFLNPTLFWAALALLAVLAAWMRRRRSLRQRELWAAEEELEDLRRATPVPPGRLSGGNEELVN